jgi:hypothetical protein
LQLSPQGWNFSFKYHITTYFVDQIFYIAVGNQIKEKLRWTKILNWIFGS